jgi:hypothetical protein
VTPSVGNSTINMYYKYIFMRCRHDLEGQDFSVIGSDGQGAPGEGRRDADLDGEERDQSGRIRLHLHGLFFMPLEENHQPIRPMTWKDTLNVPIDGDPIYRCLWPYPLITRPAA